MAEITHWHDSVSLFHAFFMFVCTLSTSLALLTHMLCCFNQVTVIISSTVMNSSPRVTQMTQMRQA